MEEVAGWLKDLPWATILGLVVGSSLVTVVLGKLLDRGASAAAARREGYARAARALVAWNEYPYRIRRRTSNDQEVVAGLVARGHDLQEELASAHAWVVADAPWMGEVFAAQRKTLSARVGPCCKEAWNSEPVRTTAEMNLNGWGPGSPEEVLNSFHAAVAWRFGPRRLVSFVGRRLHRPKDATAVRRGDRPDV